MMNKLPGISNDNMGLNNPNPYNLQPPLTQYPLGMLTRTNSLEQKSEVLMNTTYHQTFNAGYNAGYQACLHSLQQQHAAMFGNPMQPQGFNPMAPLTTFPNDSPLL